MTERELNDSLDKWRRIARYNKARPGKRARYLQATKMIERREKQLAKIGGLKPRIVRLRAPMTRLYGPLGSTRDGVGHYSAGPRPTTLAATIAHLLQYNSQHRAQGWGAIGYHICISYGGEIILCRPTSWKGAHTAGENSGRVGIVVLGGPGQRMTEEQKGSLLWLKRYGSTAAMPSTHRIPAGALSSMKVHNDLNATACPGDFEADYKGVK